MGCLTKANIIAAKDLKYEKVFVPEWAPEGCETPDEVYVMVRTMTAGERDDFEAQNVIIDQDDPAKSKMDLTDYRAKMCLLCMVDDDGNRLFAAEDIEVLSGKSALALQRVFAVCQELNGLSNKEVDKAVKKFKPVPKEDSPSD